MKQGEILEIMVDKETVETEVVQEVVLLGEKQEMTE